MSNMWQRILSGVVGAVLLLGSIWYSGWTFALLFGLIQALMLREFYRMMKAIGYKPAAFIGIGASLLIFTTAYALAVGISSGHARVLIPGFDAALGRALHNNAERYAVTLLPLLSRVTVGLLLVLPIILLLREMYWWARAKRPFSPLPNVGVALLGLFYVTLPMSGLIVLAFTDDGYDYRRIFGLLFMVWAADTGAYIAGKNFGRHKLAPSISPGKTWEGWVGGCLLTLAVGWALGYLIPELPLAHRLVAAVVVAVFGVLGDLAESMLKRSVDMKDSGRIMPGHGGLLDRFDAFLFVVPVLVVLQLLFA